jgi:hypothetical protein
MSISANWSSIQGLSKGPVSSFSIMIGGVLGSESNVSRSKTAALESDINELMVNCADRADGNGISMGTRGNSLAEGDTASENVISQGILDVDTAERYLIIFKTKLIPHFFCGCTPRHICQAVPPEEAIPLLSYPWVSSI